MSQRLNILYDGWCLAYQASSWEAIHLLSLLAHLPASVRARVALPAPPFEPLPAGIKPLLQPVENTRWGRLRWEQIILPGLARSSQSDLQHLLGIQAALFGSPQQIISPAGYGALSDSSLTGSLTSPREVARSSGLADRLRIALGQGGFSRAVGIFWPSDLPVPDFDLRVFQLPPLIHPQFTAPIREELILGLPETYIIYHGPQSDSALRRLVEAWGWASGSIGEYYPLIILGFDQSASKRLNELLQKSSLTNTVRLLPPLSLKATSYLYQKCTAVFHPADIPPWGGPLRTALLCGKPLVALETSLSDALIGSAGYLIHPDKADVYRALGAALITVIIEESISTNLAQAARQRSAGWKISDFSNALHEAYWKLIDVK